MEPKETMQHRWLDIRDPLIIWEYDWINEDHEVYTQQDPVMECS